MSHLHEHRPRIWLGATVFAVATLLAVPLAAQPGNTAPGAQPPDAQPPDDSQPPESVPGDDGPPSGGDTTPPAAAPGDAADGPPGGSVDGTSTDSSARGRIRFGPDMEPLSTEEMEVLAQAERDFLRFKEAAEGHHQRVREILMREFNQRTDDLEARYAERIRRVEEERKKRHLDTIALLEKFIEDHPDHPEFTPDAMFRLADLYLDQAEAELEAREAAGNFDDPLADYSKALALWERILDKFPDYRQRPGTMYLLAYYGRIQDERRSLTIFLALVCANKYNWNDPPMPEPTREEAKAATDSRVLENPYSDCVAAKDADPSLVQHAWLRGVGDHHFSVPGELNHAIAAYGKVANDASSTLYAEALYKLAWSYYRRDFLLEAIANFDESVKIYDATVARGEPPKLELREEALQYIAVSFTDPWDNEPDIDPVLAYQRASDYYKGRENEPHVRDVWVTLGHAFMEIQAYDQAIDAFSKAIGPPWHLHRMNPMVHQEIVNAYEVKGDKFGADQAASELATRYQPGTPWYEANEKDREAMELQRSIGERMLYAAARNTHSNATIARQEYIDAGVDDPEAKAGYLDLYAKAIQHYRNFLEQYPESEHVYVFTFGLAEALYFSEKYLDSIEHYRWVRDHRELSSQHFEDAAYSIIQAYEAEIRRLVAEGAISDIVVPTKEELAALPKPFEKRPIPQIYEDLRTAYDEYQRLVNDPKTAPLMALNAGIISMAHLHMEDAIQRFELVLERFCGANSDEVTRAKDGLLAIYEALGDDDKFKATNQAFISKQCGDAEAIELAQSQNRSIEFRRAAELFQAQQYAEAARSFYIYYKSAPADDKDLPTALYNSAIAYREADKPKTSIYLLQEFTSNKDENFRKSAYYLSALRLTAASYQNVYDYEKAIDIYMQLYEESKTAAKRGLTPPPPPPGEQPKTFEEIKLDALYNAAVLSELDRDFDRALQLYRRYEREETRRREQDRALWAVARIHRSSGDIKNMIDTYKSWRKKYGDDPVNADDYVFSYYDVANALTKRKRNSEADDYREQTIKAWERKGSIKSGKGAEYAGEFALYFAERNFNKKFVPFRITKRARTEKQAKAQRAEIDKLTKKAQDEYLALARFGVGEYAMAAKVRYGDVLSLYSQKVFEIPTPQYVLDLNDKAPELELLAKYEEGLATALQKYVEEAKESWIEVVQQGKQKNVSNRWTKLALEYLNREFPDEYPILHEELNDGTEEP